jgi:hypothetical protein
MVEYATFKTLGNVPAIHLQYIGLQPAIQVKNLHIGDVVVWNHGYTSKVVGIHPTESKKSAVFDLQSMQDNYFKEIKDGKIYQRRMLMSRWIAVNESTFKKRY